MMGLGVVEPIDDFRDDNKPSNNELLEHLTDEIVRSEIRYVRVDANHRVLVGISKALHGS